MLTKAAAVGWTDVVGHAGQASHDSSLGPVQRQEAEEEEAEG